MERILIIDDESDLSFMVKNFLQIEGYIVDTADSVADGIEIAQAYPPDLILCDWQLPDGTGADIIAQQPTAKIIVVTGNHMKILDDVDDSRIAGHIIKPFRIDVLLLAIRAALRGD